MSLISNFIVFIAWFFISIIVHELGHSITADNLGYKSKIKGFSTFVSPTPKGMDDFKILIGGWLSGFVVILIFVFSYGYSQVSGLLMIGLYLFGTRSDLKQIMGLSK